MEMFALCKYHTLSNMCYKVSCQKLKVNCTENEDKLKRDIYSKAGIILK